MRVRWRQVAELAGVSEATVSRVMNGRAGVTDRTREIVLRAVDQLGAAAPAPARRLRAGLVGLVVPELDNPVFPAFAQRLEIRLAAAGYTSVIGSATQIVDEQEYLWALVERGVEGIIVVSGRHAHTDGDHSAYRDLLRQGTAMVFVNGYARDIPAPFVSCDDRQASAMAVAHLVALGHDHIGFVSGPTRYVVVQRKREGFVAAVAAAGIEPDPDLIIDSVYSIEGGRSAAASLIERGATAVVTASDLLALGTVLGAREHGLAVPDEWSTVGYDDSALMAYTDPPLTTVRQPIGTMTEHASRLLLEQLRGHRPTNREFLFRPELVVRGSTAAVASRRTERAG
jgi:LacI family transcriptional regulator, repressor for deo operon, udp, cdd, tsx, nupC, and nupG